MTEQTNQLITITQLPVIEERLQSISAEIQAQTSRVLALAVTEDTVKEIKKHRTELTKSFTALEDQRKAVKQAVMAPYEAFEKIYKQYVTDVFKPADTQLKSRIDEVESTLLANKKADVEAYFKKSAATHGVDFLTFDRLNIKVLISDSMKKLREQVDEALKKIAGEIAYIGSLESPEEILVEYKASLDLAGAAMAVQKRRALLEEERRRLEAAARPAPPAPMTAAPPSPIDEKKPEPEPVPSAPAPAVPSAPKKSATYTILVESSSYNDIMEIAKFCKSRGLDYIVS